MSDFISALPQGRLEKEQALAKLRQLQSAAVECELLDREHVRGMWAQAFAALRDRGLGMGDQIVRRGAGRSANELFAPLSMLLTIGSCRNHWGNPCLVPIATP